MSVLGRFQFISSTPTNKGSLFPLLCMSSSLWLDVRYCDFYLVQCWIVLFSCKYSWALLWDAVQILGKDPFVSYFGGSSGRTTATRNLVQLFPPTEARSLWVLHTIPREAWGFPDWQVATGTVPGAMWVPGTIPGPVWVLGTVPLILSDGFFLASSSFTHMPAPTGT